MTMAAVGDIIYVKRKGYRHFGIYAGDQRVIHYYKERNPLLSDGIIAETSLEEFMSDSDTVYVMNGLGSAEYKKLFDWILQKMSSGTVRSFSPQETVARARSKLGERGYNLLFNNCEHFSFWCKTGVSRSSQTDDILSLLLFFVPHPSQQPQIKGASVLPEKIRQIAGPDHAGETPSKGINP